MDLLLTRDFLDMKTQAVLRIEETSRAMNKVCFLTSARRRKRGFRALRQFAVEWFALRLRQCNQRKYTKHQIKNQGQK